MSIRTSGSHTAVVIDRRRDRSSRRCRSVPGGRSSRSCWRGRHEFEDRVWAIESAGGLGYLLGQQLVGAGERVLDVPATLAARVRVLATSRSNKNDPNDALSIAIAARARTARDRRCSAADHAVVLRLFVKRNAIWVGSGTGARVGCQRCCASSPGRNFQGNHAEQGATAARHARAGDAGRADPPRARAAITRGPPSPRRPRCAPRKRRIEAAVAASGTTADRHLRGRADRRRDGHRPHPRRRPVREP